MTTALSRSLPGFDALLAQRAPTGRGLAEVALEELRALRDVDAVAPPEAAALAEALSARFGVRPRAADRLRLPLLTHHDGVALRAAVGRILGADVSAPVGDRDALLREQRMRRALHAIEGTLRHVGEGLKLTV